MDEKKRKNEELQSRREFFKKAAKGALPILGAVLMANVPVISQAAEKPMGCNFGCSYSCVGSCSGGCMGCRGTCTGGCSALCGGNCVAGCYGSCKLGCSGYTRM